MLIVKPQTKNSMNTLYHAKFLDARSELGSLKVS